MSFPTNGLADLLQGTNDTLISTPEEWRKKRPEVRDRLAWGLGEAPDYAESEPGAYGAETRAAATLLGRANVPDGLAKRSLNFGNYVAGDLYFPTNADKGDRKLPVVIWLHPISNPTGYVPGYKRGENPHLSLAKLGFAVLAFDQMGNGSRLEEIRNFYSRYPQWSVLGKHIEDTLAGVEALQKVEFIDPKRIYLLGYAAGGMTALHAAALDERIAGVVSVAGFTSMRSDRIEKGTGGVARWSVWLPFQPKLGAFVGQETRIPYDYHEVLAMIAPRPALVFTPKIDTQATLADVKRCVEEAGAVYDLFEAKDKLQLRELDDYNHFSPETQRVVFEQIERLGGL